MMTFRRVFAACLTFTILLSLAGTTSAAVTGTLAWTAQGPDGEYPGLVLDSAGNAIESALYGQLLTKYNSAGQVVWSHTVSIMYQGTAAYLTGNMVVDSAGNIYVSGANDFRYAPQAAVLGLAKRSPNGTVLWTSSYVIGSGGEHMAVGPLALGTNGSLYVIGTAANFSRPTAAVSILKVDASTGALQKKLPTPPLVTEERLEHGEHGSRAGFREQCFLRRSRRYPQLLIDLQTLRWVNNQFAVRAVVLDAVNNVYVAGYLDTAANPMPSSSD